jgi:hypothetical protein
MPPRHNPATRYPHPQAVLDDARLSPAQKAELLDEWALDLGDRSTASDEGMASPSPARTDRDVQMLDRVIAAQASLEPATASPQPAAPAKPIA